MFSEVLNGIEAIQNAGMKRNIEEESRADEVSASNPFLFVSRFDFCFPNSTGNSYPALRAIRCKHGNEDVIVYESCSSSRCAPSSYIHLLDDYGNVPVNGVAATVEYPLNNIDALRLRQTHSRDSKVKDTVNQTRLNADLAIGVMIFVQDGPDRAFTTALHFSLPREKLPWITSFVSRYAALGLAFLRIEVQKAFLVHKVPM